MLHITSDILLPSENYLLMLMFEVSLSLVYHVIRVTYVQFLTITNNFVTIASKIVKDILL